MDNPNKPDLFFYIVFDWSQGKGHTTLRQTWSPNGFNIAGAHQWLREQFQRQVLIVSWIEIPEARHLDFREYLTNLPTAQTPELRVVPGGKDSAEPPTPAGVLTLQKFTDCDD